MRVLLISDWPPPEGGTERYVSMVRAGLRRAGDEVRLLTSNVGSAAGGTAEYVAYGSMRRSEQSVLQIFNPSAARTTRRAIEEFRPDAVHLSMFLPHLSPAVLGPIRNVPTVLTACDPKPVCTKDSKLLPDGSLCANRSGIRCWREGCIGLPRAARDAPRYALLRRGLRHIDRVLTISRWMRSALADDGIEAELVDLPVNPPRHGFERRPAPEPTFVFAGRLSPEKGVDVLIRSFATLLERIPAARLRIVGDGPDRDRIIALAETVSPEAIGVVPRMSPEWTDELSTAWALVAPSVNREPLGLVAIEACVHGVPVIATADGGFAETIEDGVSGLIVPRGDEAALTDAMNSIAQRRTFADHALPPPRVDAIRRRHDLEAHVDRLRGVFGELQQTATAAR